MGPEVGSGVVWDVVWDLVREQGLMWELVWSWDGCGTSYGTC